MDALRQHLSSTTYSIKPSNSNVESEDISDALAAIVYSVFGEGRNNESKRKSGQLVGSEEGRDD